MNKVVFGLVWLVVIYVGLRTGTGAVAGGIAGSKEHTPQMSARAGAAAGAKAVQDYHKYILGASVTLAIIGSGLGILPGTRTQTRQLLR